MLVPASGAAGLAFGAWALRRGGMQVRDIAVTYFVFKSAVNYEGRLCVRCAIPELRQPATARFRNGRNALSEPLCRPSEPSDHAPEPSCAPGRHRSATKLFPVCSPSGYSPRATEHAH